MDGMCKTSYGKSPCFEMGGGVMKPHEAWQSVLGQLQLEMPRASFESWVRDTEVISFEKNVLTICARNAYAKDWLESRLADTIQKMLKGILNQSVLVQYVVSETLEAKDEDDEIEETDLVIEPVQWLDYDRIVQPHRQVVVKGYLRRLGMEIGPKAIWLYIGFHQAAWMAKDTNAQPLHSRLILRYSALSHGAFWRLLKHRMIQQGLAGLVQRVDDPALRRFRRGRDGRPHRAPIRYRVCMTPRLTRADATTVYSRLRTLLDRGASILNALQELLDTENVMQLLTPQESANPHIPFDTVMDMAHFEAGGTFDLQVDHLAQELQRRITNSLGDIHITHYFITDTIKRFNLTPAQAWLITIARDMAYINSHTGERREIVTFKGGYLEMAALVGSNRYKTVQAWFNLHWSTQQRGGDITRFLVELEAPESNIYPDLRADSMSRTYRVLLDEPLDANGTNTTDANGSIRLDADGSHNQTQMEGLVDANGINMVDANGSVLNSFKHPLNTDRKNTSTTQHARCRFANPSGEGAVPKFWELETLLGQNDVHPKVQRELLEVQASVHAFVSWVLYVASPASGNLSDPLGYAISRLREHSLREARGVFRKFADLPPEELLILMDSTPQGAYALPVQVDHPLANAWKKAMGSNNPMLPLVRTILFGQGEEE
jgi:hypothetical protein